MEAVKYHPFKALWTLIAIVFNAIRLPFWLLYFAPSFLRQHPRWTYAQAVRIRIMRAFLYNVSLVEMSTPLSLKPGKEGDQFVVLEKTLDKYYTGVTIQDVAVRPERIGATWYPKMPKRAEDVGVVVLHFHGGAFVIGDGRKEDAGFLATTLLKNTRITTVFCPQYRLSSNPGCRFPAQLQDAITSYCYLVFDLGIEPRRIVISGDSAGGNLALALLRYLSDHGSELFIPNPGCSLLWSPWVSPKGSFYDSQAMNKSPNFQYDYLSGAFGAWGARTLSPSPTSGLSIDHSYINPLNNPFSSKTPMYITTGECEVLFHEDVRLYEQMSQINGNEVELQVEELAVHDIILTGGLNGFAAEAQKAARRAGVFLDKHVKM